MIVKLEEKKYNSLMIFHTHTRRTYLIINLSPLMNAVAVIVGCSYPNIITHSSHSWRQIKFTKLLGSNCKIANVRSGGNFYSIVYSKWSNDGILSFYTGNCNIAIEMCKCRKVVSLLLFSYLILNIFDCPTSFSQVVLLCWLFYPSKK